MVDKALLVWFQQKIVFPNVRIHGDMLLAKANQFAENFGYESAVSMAWVDCFKNDITSNKCLKVEKQLV